LAVNVKLESQPFKSGKPVEQKTDQNGESIFCLQLNRNYAFAVSEPGYLFFSSFMNQGSANSVMEPYTLDINLQPIEIGAEVQLYSIYFDTDSFRILPQSGAELQNLVTFLKNNGDLKVEVQGHTDSSGNAEKNKILSELRAKSVVDYLTENGIKISRLKFSGYGDKNPIATNETAEGRMLNRRTTIKILEK
jgi:outer membrane protein OmpA-like peptidoglycan-associated protein